MLKKMLNSVVLLLAIVLIFSFVFSGNVQAEEEFTIILGHNAAMGSHTDRGSHILKEVVEALTDGKVKVEIYPANELGGNREMLEGTGMGSQDIAIQGIGVMSYMIGPYAFLQMPYLFESQEHIHAFTLTETVQEFAETAKNDHNVKMLSQTWDRMPRQIAGTKPIYGPDDVEGFLIRAGTEPVVEYYRAIGAQSTHIPLGEMYMGLQQGVIEGAELPIDYFYDYSIYEVADYLSMVNHVYGVQMVGINYDTWQELPENYQMALKAGVEAGKSVNNHLVWSEQDGYIKLLEEAGMEFVTFDEVDYEAFVDKLSENIDELYEVWPDAVGIFEEIVNLEI